MTEDVIVRLKGIKALLCHVSETNTNVCDSEYGLMLLCEELEKCIQELKEV